MAFDNEYADCLKKMFGLRRFGIKLGLDIISGMLTGLGSPQQQFRCIHIAGTNGKGSVASTLATILQTAGYRVGLYTSPHLVHFNERIQTNGQPISNESVVASYLAVEKAHQGNREPTFFEFTTAMALYEFSRQQVDWAIIETGMGGRLDATNVLRPNLSIITNISLEHQSYLGNTLAAIAAEKGGIIKEGVPVITGAGQKPVIEVLTRIAQKKSAPLYRFGNAFRIRRHPDGTFTYYGLDQQWAKLRTGLKGEHQAKNAALVLAACEVLNRLGLKLLFDHLQAGLLNTHWPGRLEIISESPLVILDGAHNLSAVRILSQYLAAHYADRNITLVTGILDDKAYTPMLRQLLPLCKKAVFTQPKIDRALPPETFLTVAKEFIPSPEVIPSVPDAVAHAVQTAKKDEVICIAGSLYLVGEVKGAIEAGTLVLNPPNSQAITFPA
ncbi:MAG: folylpolyglutamate synthase/dihydrofolate synthase family protein [Desulfobacterales bacterium]|jgi:dihydrofolate synthase/folylpolyglutamate synthase|nr:folylpolyglutamate synthase/dihydrofolate synthase family protein [Desulfobacterales bacterium]